MSYATALRSDECREDWVCETEHSALPRKLPTFGRQLHQARDGTAGWKIGRVTGSYQTVYRLSSNARVIERRAEASSETELIELRRLADEWRQATVFLSSITQKILHPAYQKIIGFGDRALPFLVGELRNSGGYWFWALNAISRDDPVPPGMQGNYQAMKDAWIEWAEQRGI